MNVENKELETDVDVDVEVGESSTEEPEIRYNVTSYGWDTDVEGLVRRLNKGDIYVPEFQRKFVWNSTEQSKFIESLILGLPVPSIFLAVDQDTKKMNIIDGQQRLKTLQKYFSGEFGLTGKGIQENLKGLRYKLPEGKKNSKILLETDRRTLENAVIHAVVLKEDNTEGDENQFDEAIIQIFSRLNTTGKALQAQEVRSCIYHGDLNSLLGELNKDENWRAIFGNEHSRLKDVEAILRFISLFYEHETYKAPMPKFLDNFMRRNRFMIDDRKDEISDLFQKSVKLIFEISGKSLFKPKTTFLLSRFDAIMIGLSSRLKDKAITQTELKAAIKKIEEHEDFIWSISEFVNDSDRVSTRIKVALEVFKNV